VPAAAVIPAPIAYIKVAAVKTFVVEIWLQLPRLLNRKLGVRAFGSILIHITLKKSERSKLALA
jgi:hypothetical protein